MRARIFVLMFDCVALAGGLAYLGVHLRSRGRQADEPYEGTTSLARTDATQLGGSSSS